MLTLIIPDIHNHTENADYWLETQQFDRVVFLGDYFDDFGDDVNDARRTALWLKKRMDSGPDGRTGSAARAGDIFLIGNHDASYLFPRSEELYCPGFTKAKAKGIHEILRPEHWVRLQLAYSEQGWLMSHAGFHPVWMKEPTIDRILNRCEQAMKKAAKQVVDPLLGAGQDRGGLQRFGGPLWMDWSSLTPILGINQVVGHTPCNHVREKTIPGSSNFCLDVKNGLSAAILTDGELTILERK